MNGLVTSKGQVTIPKSLRERYGIRAGMEISFSPGPNGIELHKVVERNRKSKALGCLKDKLAGRAVSQWLDELRGTVSLPPVRKRRNR